MKDYLLEGKLHFGKEAALVELETLLEQRIKHHEQSGANSRSGATAILNDMIQGSQ